MIDRGAEANGMSAKSAKAGYARRTYSASQVHVIQPLGPAIGHVPHRICPLRRHSIRMCRYMATIDTVSHQSNVPQETHPCRRQLASPG
jgi:hypothetical protein